MANNISFQFPPSFNTDPSSSLVQENWSFSASLPTIGFLGSNNPSPATVVATIPDFRKTYPDMFVNIYISIQVEADIPFFSVSGDVAEAPARTKIVSDADLQPNTIITYDFAGLLSEDYEASLIHVVEGETAEGNFVELDRYYFPIAFSLLNNSEVAIRPNNYENIDFVLGDPNPTFQRTIYAQNSFSIIVPDFVTVTGIDIVLDDENEGMRTYIGTGQQTVTVEINPFHPNFYASFLFELIQDDSFDSFGVAMRNYDDPIHTVTPDILEFSAVKGLQEADAKTFQILGANAYTITVPHFLTLESPASGSGSAVIRVKPIHSDNLSPGVYTNRIKILSGIFALYLPVQYKVVERIDRGFDSGALNFTKDRAGITTVYDISQLVAGGFEERSSDVKVDFEVGVKAFEYYSNDSRRHHVRFMQGLFNNSTNFWLGDVANQTMPSLEKLPDFIFSEGGGHTIGGWRPRPVYPFYHPSENRFVVRFSDRNSGAPVGETIVEPNVRYLKGRKPARYNAGLGIIDFLKSPVRVTKKSVAILPIYAEKPAVVHIFRNGVRSAVESPDSGEFKFFGYQLKFNGYVPGDIIDVHLFRTGGFQTGTEMMQRYIVFPEGKETYHIAWETEHGVPFLMEFTGDYSFNLETKGIVAESFQKFLEFRQKTGTNRTLKFKANTGWILKSNQERIDSLANSKKAWIVFGDGRAPIEIIPEDAKLTNSDNSAQIYQYTLDFKINPRHEIENNPSQL